MIRAVVVAGSALDRAGIEALLASDPDIVLDADGSDVIVQVADSTAPEPLADAERDAPVVLVVDEGAAPDWVRDAVRSGARAVLPRTATAVELAAAVRAAAAGLVVLEPATAGSILSVSQPPRAADQPLTARELQVLRMLADGLANKNIAYELGISEHTVKFHVAAILSKLNASSRTDAVAIGMRRGYILL